MRLLILIALTAAGGWSQIADAKIKQIVGDQKFQAVNAFLDADYDLFVRELIELTEIPAPPFKEKVRAQAYLERLRRLGDRKSVV